MSAARAVESYAILGCITCKCGPPPAVRQAMDDLARALEAWEESERQPRKRAKKGKQ